MGSGLCTWTSALRSSKKFTLGAVSGDPLGWSPAALRKAILLREALPQSVVLTWKDHTLYP